MKNSIVNAKHTTRIFISVNATENTGEIVTYIGMNIQQLQILHMPQTHFGGAQQNAADHRQVYYTPDGNVMQVQGETIRIFVPNVAGRIRQNPLFLS